MAIYGAFILVISVVIVLFLALRTDLREDRVTYFKISSSLK